MGATGRGGVSERPAAKYPDTRALFTKYKALYFEAGQNTRGRAALTLSPSRTAVALDITGVNGTYHGGGTPFVALSHTLALLLQAQGH